MDSVSRNKDKGNALQRYFKSFCHALNGIWYALRHEHNMIIIFICGIFTVIAGFAFHISALEWLFCIISIGLVAGAEMINTAIEATIDLITLEEHPLAKIAKDTVSSATLIFAMMSFAGALIIFVPKAMELLK